MGTLGPSELGKYIIRFFEFTSEFTNRVSDFTLRNDLIDVNLGLRRNKRREVKDITQSKPKILC